MYHSVFRSLAGAFFWLLIATNIYAATPPVFTSTAVTSGEPGALYHYTVTGSDVEGSVLSVQSTALPAWLSLDALVKEKIGTVVGDGTTVPLSSPRVITFDAQGNLYIADTSNHRIRKIDTNGSITTVAGTGVEGFSGDGGDATAAQLAAPASVSVDSNGTLYIADTRNDRIRKVDTNGSITTIAGTGRGVFSGDGAAATAAELSSPEGVAVDASGNLYIADSDNNRIRRVDINGIITTVAGSGAVGYSGDGAAATAAALNAPNGVTVDTHGNLYITDTFNHVIRKVDASGVITTVAGTGVTGYSGDGAAATEATLNLPWGGISIDVNANLYIADTHNHRIRKVDASGIITTVAGSGVQGYSGDNALATAAALHTPSGVAVDANATLYIADSGNYRVRKLYSDYQLSGTPAQSDVGDHNITLTLSDDTNSTQQHFTITINNAPVFTTVANTVAIEDSNYSYRVAATDVNGDTLTYSALTLPGWLSFDALTQTLFGTPGNIDVGVHNVVLRVNDGTVDVDQEFLVTVSNTNDTPVITTTPETEATEEMLYHYSIIGSDADGNALSVTSTTLPAWLSLSESETVKIGTVAGDGTAARLYDPKSVAVDANGNFYMADSSNHRIQKVDANGIVTTVAGTGTAGYSGDNHLATQATLYFPEDVAVDDEGNLYIADTQNGRIRKVDINGIITTVAGSHGTGGFSGDGGVAIDAVLGSPKGVAVDSSGNLYIADSAHSRIRKVDTNGIISTVAGTGAYSFSGDDGSATMAELSSPEDVVVDSAGNLYIADSGNHRIRKVDTGGVITTVAGTGAASYNGDGTLATAAALNYPAGITMDGNGNLYIADVLNHRIRKVDIGGVITTIAGSGTAGFSGDNAVATAAQLREPWSVAVDGSGTLYIADSGNNRIRKLYRDYQLSGTPGNGDVGSYEITLTLSDGTDTTEQTFTLTVTNTNDLPVFTTTPSLTHKEKAFYSYTCAAADVDSADSLTYDAPTLPAWLSFDASTRQLSGTPVNTDVGIHTVVLRVYDGTEYVQQSFTITVMNANNVPVITSTAITSATEDLLYSYRVIGSDVDGNPLNVTSTPLPLWLSLNELAREKIGTVAGDGLSEELNDPKGVAVDGNGNLYIADTRNHRIRKVDTSGNITTVAGTGVEGYGGDNALATEAQLSKPWDVSVDERGNLYIADTGNNRIRKVDTSGIITTLAGTGLEGAGGDGTIAIEAGVFWPMGVAVDGSMNVYIVDYYSKRIRKVDTSGIITTVAGGGSGFIGDGGAATEAELGNPTDVAVDERGNFYIAGNNCVRKVDINGIISTVATGFDDPRSVAVDLNGNVYVADASNHRIQKVDTDGIVTTVAGLGTTGFSGDGAMATTAQLAAPEGVSVDDSGALYIADSGNNRVRKLYGDYQLSGTPENGNVGSHAITLTLGDGIITVQQPFSITVINTNDAPLATTTPITVAMEQIRYRYTFAATDVDVGDTLTYSAPSLPGWLNFNASTGLLSGTPINMDVGEYTIVLRVSDGRANVDQLFTVTVRNRNDAPVITSTVITAATEDNSYSYTINATDADGDVLTYSAQTLPSWLDFDASTRTLSGAPGNENVGSHSVELRVSDGMVDVYQRYTVTVANVNDAPIFSTTALTTLTEETPYSYRVAATDIDAGDTLIYSAPTLPGWLSFDASTRHLSGTPDNAQIGEHSVVLRVSDGSVEVDQHFTVVVERQNDAPIVTTTAATATEDSSYRYTIAATDNDGDALIYSAPALPNWLSFNTATGLLFGTPTNSEVGEHNVTLRVSDGMVDVDQNFIITVANVNDAPHISGTPETMVMEEGVYTFVPISGDVDVGDTLIFSIANKPVWATFDATTGVLSGAPVRSDVGITPDIVITVSDNNGARTSLAAFTLEVKSLNSAPTIISVPPVSIAEDGNYSYTLVATDVDANDTLSLSAPILPEWLRFDALNGLLFGTPTNSEVGEHNVTVRVNDGTVNVDQNFTITVVNTNDAPIATAQRADLREDSNITDLLIANDMDPTSDMLSFAIAEGSVAPVGLTLDSNGTYHFDASSYDSLPEGTQQTFIVPITVRDGNGGSVTVALTITVTGVNGVAVISGISTGSVSADTVMLVSGRLIISDEDSGEALLIAQLDAAGSYGVFNVNTDGSWNYQLDYTNSDVQSLGVGEELTDFITVSSYDMTAQQVIAVSITGVNGIAVISGIYAGEISEDAMTQVSGILSISDRDSGQAFFIAQDDTIGTYGTFNIDANGNWSYVLDNANSSVQALAVGESLRDTFTVTSVDGSDTQEVVITITGTNDAPTVDVHTAFATESDTVITGSVVASDVDNNATLTYAITAGSVEHEGFTLESDGSYQFDLRDGAYEYLLDGESVTLSIAITVTDDQGATAETTLMITITGSNDVPSIDVLSDIIHEQSALPISRNIALELSFRDGLSALSVLSSNDAFFSTKSVTRTSDTTGWLHYTVAANQVGSAVLSVVLKDRDGEVATRSFKVVVRAANEALCVEEVKNALTFELIKGANSTQSYLFYDLTPVHELAMVCSAAITWSSSDEALLSTAGQVSRTTVENTVVYTATITQGEFSARKPFLLMIAQVDMTDAQRVEKAAQVLSFEMIRHENSRKDRIMSHLSLPSVGLAESDITWSSTNTGAIDPTTGMVTRGANATFVTLSATLRLGDATAIRHFDLSVPGVPLTSAAKVLGDVAWLSLSQILGSNRDDKSIVSNLRTPLPLVGPNGSVIRWNSSNEALITSDGYVIRDNDEDKYVELIAMVADRRVSFLFNVLKAVGEPVTVNDFQRIERSLEAAAEERRIAVVTQENGVDVKTTLILDAGIKEQVETTMTHNSVKSVIELPEKTVIILQDSDGSVHVGVVSNSVMTQLSVERTYADVAVDAQGSVTISHTDVNGTLMRERLTVEDVIEHIVLGSDQSQSRVLSTLPGVRVIIRDGEIRTIYEETFTTQSGDVLLYEVIVVSDALGYTTSQYRVRNLLTGVVSELDTTLKSPFATGADIEILHVVDADGSEQLQVKVLTDIAAGAELVIE